MRDRNAPQKQVWRTEFALLSADGVGTNEIKRRTGKSKLASGAGRNVSRTRASRACCATRRAPRALRRSDQKLPHAWLLSRKPIPQPRARTGPQP